MILNTGSPGDKSKELGPIHGLISFLNMRIVASVKLPKAEMQERTSATSKGSEECQTT
jgi:hypothetical protein